jgi:MarR family transcriptional regulator for hemolysin
MVSETNYRLGFRMAETSRLWRAELDARLRPLGLSQARWLALVNLRDQPDGLTQNELALRIGIRDSTLVRQLDLLAADGWIERRDDPADRRVKRVFITDKAAPSLAAIYDVAAELRREVMQDISDEEVLVCLSVFARMRERLTTFPTSASRRNNDPERHVAAAE